MVERMEGICEKHQLPLDRDGECELCRLSDMASDSPPARIAWWAVLIPLVLAVAGIAWALSSFGSGPQNLPQRGVRTTAPRPCEPAAKQRGAASRPSPRGSKVPEPPRPPVPGDDIPVPEPSPDEWAALIDFVRTPETRFDGIPDYPFEPKYFEVDGLRMHYIDEGREKRAPCSFFTASRAGRSSIAT